MFFGDNMNEFNFYHLTDLHYYANKVIGSSGKSYELKNTLDQKCMEESDAIIDAAFENILSDEDTDIVLISGDLTFDGEVQSHDELKKKLQMLQSKGKRVFITFATHDFYMHAQKYTDEGNIDLPKYTREELRRHYDEFGYSAAVSVHENSYSYCVQLTDDVRLLALNDDGDFDEFCGYYDDLLEWIKEQVADAHKNGCEIFAMTHHPLLEPSPVYPLISHKAMLGGYETTAPFFADLGIKYVFVGHTHIHDINSLKTEKGNTLYQINTAALTAYPLAYRKITYGNEGMNVRTLQVEKINADTKGMSALDYAKDHFTYMIRLVFESIEKDYEKFIVLSQGFSGNEKVFRKLKPILQPLGKYLNGLTFKRIARVFCCSKSVEAVIADKKVVPFLCQVILNMYSGTENYSPETAEYKITMAICKKLRKFIKIKDYHNNPVDFCKLVSRLLYDDGIDDWNTILQ